jgi:hypothetical protein
VISSSRTQSGGSWLITAPVASWRGLARLTKQSTRRHWRILSRTSFTSGPASSMRPVIGWWPKQRMSGTTRSSIQTFSGRKE